MIVNRMPHLLQFKSRTTTTLDNTTIIFSSLPNCTYSNYYCNPTSSNLIKKVDDRLINSASHCSEICGGYGNYSYCMCKLRGRLSVVCTLQTCTCTTTYFKEYLEVLFLNCKIIYKHELIIFSTEKCNDFTYFHFRNKKTCFLLQKCDDKRPLCHVRGSCVSGGHCRSVIVYFG